MDINYSILNSEVSLHSSIVVKYTHVGTDKYVLYRGTHSGERTLNYNSMALFRTDHIERFHCIV